MNILFNLINPDGSPAGQDFTPEAIAKLEKHFVARELQHSINLDALAAMDELADVYKQLCARTDRLEARLRHIKAHDPDCPVDPDFNRDHPCTCWLSKEA